MKESLKIRKIAFVGDHLPRQVRHRHVHVRPAYRRRNAGIPKASAWQCRSMIFRAATSNPEVVASKLRSRDFAVLPARRGLPSTSTTWTSSCLQHEFGIYVAGPAGGHILALSAAN